MKNFKTYKNEKLKDRKIKEAYNELGPEFEIVRLLIEKRLEKGITQKELAEMLNTKQSAISRLESGEYNPSLHFLYKVARALGVKIKVDVR